MGPCFHFSCITGGNDWKAFLDSLRPVSDWFVPFFLFFITLVCLGVMNVLTAMFVESAKRIAKVDQELAIQDIRSQNEGIMNDLKAIFREADDDSSGTLSRKELDKHLEDPDIAARFELLGLDTSEARGFFHLLDLEDSGEVYIDEFVHGMVRIKGAAKGVDIATLLYEHKRMLRQFDGCTQQISEYFRLILHALQCLRNQAGGELAVL